MKLSFETLDEESKQDLHNMVVKGKIVDAINYLTEELSSCNEDETIKLNILLNNLEELKDLERKENDT